MIGFHDPLLIDICLLVEFHQSLVMFVECGCYDAGTIAGLSMCEQVSGQCQCKMSVTGRTCDRCKDGYYNLQKENIHGCVGRFIPPSPQKVNFKLKVH